MVQDSDHRHCAEAVRAFDRERWLAATLAPASVRPRLLALYAFDLELARTPEMVSEPMLGQIRLQWWREAVAAAASGEPREQPVARALASLTEATTISPASLTALVDAFEDELAADPPETLEAFVARCRATGGALARLACDVLAVADDRTRTAAEDAGTAHAMARRLVATAALARRGRIDLPRALLRAHGVDPRSLLAGRPDAGLGTATRDVAAEARALIDSAREPRRSATREALAVLALARIAEVNLAALARGGYDLFGARTAPAPVSAPLAVVIAALTGRY